MDTATLDPAAVNKREASLAEPLFSIITVTWNAAAVLVPTMRSVAEQTCRNFEHLIIDGASTDDTLRIAGEMGAGERTRIFSEPDEGLYDAMNKGMDRAKGKYLIFLNAGDAFHSADTLSRIASAVRENEMPGILYGQTQVVDEHRHRVGDRHLTAPEKLTLESFADGMVVCHQAFVVLARIASPYNTAYRFSADYEWCIRCLQHSRRNVYVPGIMIDFLEGGLTNKNHRASLMERFRIMCRYYGAATAVRKHIAFIPRALRRRKKENKSSQEL